jgi:hypothetical protein
MKPVEVSRTKMGNAKTKLTRLTQTLRIKT